MTYEIRPAIHVGRQRHPIVQYVEMLVICVRGSQEAHFCQMAPARRDDTNLNLSVIENIHGRSYDVYADSNEPSDPGSSLEAAVDLYHLSRDRFPSKFCFHPAPTI